MKMASNAKTVCTNEKWKGVFVHSGGSVSAVDTRVSSGSAIA